MKWAKTFRQTIANEDKLINFIKLICLQVIYDS